MATCPFCNLIFRSHNEVPSHIHHEHHRLSEDESLELEVSVARQAELNWGVFHKLQSAVCEPSVSLLLPTIPTAFTGRMANIDRRWLDMLAKNAYRRMAQVLHPETLATMERRLDKAVAAAELGPYDKGLAVFVSARQIALFRLPIAPRARAAVGRSFAVRDLLLSLQCFPRYRVLVIGAHVPRVLEGWGNHLTEVELPTSAPREQANAAGPDATVDLLRSPADSAEVEADGTLYEGHHRAEVREADAVLAERARRTTELPLVVIGPAGLLTAWSQGSRYSALAIGTVRTHHLAETSHAIAQMAGRRVAAWQEAVEAVDIACLEHAERNGLIEWGISAASSAIASGKVEHLWVGRDFSTPLVVPVPGALASLIATGAHWAIEDAVEELIRSAMAAGAQVHLVQTGTLKSKEAIGAQLASDSAERRSSHVQDDSLKVLAR